MLIGPGQTANTFILRFFNSSRNALDKLITYAFVDEYTAIRVFGANDAIEQELIISLRSFINGSVAAVIAVSASQLRRTIAVFSCSDNLSKLPSLPKPALLISNFTVAPFSFRREM